MIDRDILKRGVTQFDFFNDFIDTKQWLKVSCNERAPRVLKELEKQHKLWLKDYWTNRVKGEKCDF